MVLVTIIKYINFEYIFISNSSKNFGEDLNWPESQEKPS